MRFQSHPGEVQKVESTKESTRSSKFRKVQDQDSLKSKVSNKAKAIEEKW